MEEVIKALIRRKAEYDADSSAPFPLITMGGSSPYERASVRACGNSPYDRVWAVTEQIRSCALLGRLCSTVSVLPSLGFSHQGS